MKEFISYDCMAAAAKANKMEAKHTTGPLRIVAPGDEDANYNQKQIHICADLIPVAYLASAQGKSKANAQRIVLTWNTHDDLVAALEDARETLDSFLIGKIPAEHRTDELWRILHKMNEVVTKAKGETP